MLQSLTTANGLNYSYMATVGEYGEVTYRVERVAPEGAIPVGSFVIHPDYHVQPKVPGLVNVQFGAGSPQDRHQRTDVPNLGSASVPFVVGHKLINPLEIIAGDEPFFFLPDLAGAQTATGTSSVPAAMGTVVRTTDLVVALVKAWMARPDLDALTAKYAEFIKSDSPWTKQYVEAVAARMDVLATDIMSVSERINELAKQRDELPEGGVTSPDVTPDMTPSAQLTGAINALKLKRGELIQVRARLTTS
jgi:hypothetical protein